MAYKFNEKKYILYKPEEFTFEELYEIYVRLVEDMKTYHDRSEFTCKHIKNYIAREMGHQLCKADLEVFCKRLEENDIIKIIEGEER